MNLNVPYETCFSFQNVNDSDAIRNTRLLKKKKHQRSTGKWRENTQISRKQSLASLEPQRKQTTAEHQSHNQVGIQFILISTVLFRPQTPYGHTVG